MYQFNKKWGARGKPKFNSVGEYENRAINYTINLNDTVVQQTDANMVRSLFIQQSII